MLPNLLEAFFYDKERQKKNRENYDLTLFMPKASASKSEVTVIGQCLQANSPNDL